jgi:hypothetical protein
VPAPIRTLRNVHAPLLLHVSIAGSLVRDPDGRDLPDATPLGRLPRSAALDLMHSDMGRPVKWHPCFFEVRDEQDEVVLEFPFLEAIEIEAGPS